MRYFCICVSVFIACGPGRAQTETTASFSGVVSDSSGAPVVGALVSLKHEQSGSVARVRTNRSGDFTLEGLRVGGGHMLTVSAAGFASRIIGPLSQGPGNRETLDIVMKRVGEDVYQMERMVVTARRDLDATGAGTTLGERAIEEQPTIEGSINEYARNDPRLVLLPAENDLYTELSAAGQNSFFNALQIDGVRLDDAFGITYNNLPSEGNPFSMETVEAVTIDVSPYEARRGGFTGASINAVTKSGGNRFHGTAYYLWRNEKYRAAHPLYGTRDPFQSRTYGLTLGGPVIPNRLFFFVSYEHSQRTEPAPAPGFVPSAAALESIKNAAATYGYDPGDLTNPGRQRMEDNKYLAKLDWNITNRHRLSARYSQTRGHHPVFADYSSSKVVSLSGHWYETEQNLDAWSAQLFSQWTNSLSTDLKIARQHYTSDRNPATRFPQVRINNLEGIDGGTGSVYIGADATSQINSLVTNVSQAAGSATWMLGTHRLSAGFDLQRNDFVNNYLDYAWGSYTFTNINAFVNGTPISSFNYKYPREGHAAGVDWGYGVDAFYMQDAWRATRRLHFTLGLRVDYPTMADRPDRNAAVEEAFGMRNDNTIDGAYTISPRFSFTWDAGATRRVQVRGGAGIFQGRAPGVWMSGAYSNTGFSTLTNTRTSGGFSPDPGNQPKGEPAAARMSVDLMDENFHLPEVTRANLAVDYKLPWLDLTATAEIVQTWTNRGMAYKNINLRRTTTGPDGRAIYGDRNAALNRVSNSQYANDKFADVYMLANTSGGDARQVTFRLRRPVRSWWGASLSYTSSRARDLNPATSKTGLTNFSTRMSLDPNDDELGIANTQIRDRVTAAATLRFSLVRKFQSTLSLYYQGHSGRPYSFTFTNDANGDAAGQYNDLFYVPSGPGDPNVYWSAPEQSEAFFAYLEANPALRRFAGRVAPRNSERSKFQHRVDLQFMQQIPIFKALRGEFFCNIINFANLLNPEWGRFYQMNFPFALGIANGKYNPATNQYLYTYTGAPKSQSLQSTASRWQIQTGVRIKF
ncbi:MAG: carboxypeptidase regulatory-like domain-containing protein [Opitutaceae bacterium]|nr:carboxypeptidase regulatory-like domain-containing protein [Opitutaceae bacterium]